MTTIKELMDFQNRFDDNHGWRWSAVSNEKMQRLQEGALCITGELGEFANVLKKIMRHSERNMDTKELWAGLREELTDVFIYFLKLADLLEMEIDKEYFDKMAINARKFEKFLVNKGT